jgi:hypothetical protein
MLEALAVIPMEADLIPPAETLEPMTMVATSPLATTVLGLPRLLLSLLVIMAPLLAALSIGRFVGSVWQSSDCTLCLLRTKLLLTEDIRCLLVLTNLLSSM